MIDFMEGSNYPLKFKYDGELKTTEIADWAERVLAEAEDSF